MIDYKLFALIILIGAIFFFPPIIIYSLIKGLFWPGLVASICLGLGFGLYFFLTIGLDKLKRCDDEV